MVFRLGGIVVGVLNVSDVLRCIVSTATGFCLIARDALTPTITIMEDKDSASLCVVIDMLHQFPLNQHGFHRLQMVIRWLPSSSDIRATFGAFGFTSACLNEPNASQKASSRWPRCNG